MINELMDILQKNHLRPREPDKNVNQLKTQFRTRQKGTVLVTIPVIYNIKLG